MYYNQTTNPIRIIDGRYYIALRDPPMLIRPQPLDGFSSTQVAEQFLCRFLEFCGTDRGRYAIIEAAQIEQERDDARDDIRAGRPLMRERAGAQAQAGR